MDRIRQALDRARAERGLAEEHGQRPLPGLARGPQDAPAAEAAATDLAAAGVSRAHMHVDPSPTLFDADPALFERHRIVAGDRLAPAARAFRMLRTQVLQRMDAHGWRTLGIVSARSGDGKTTTAVNLGLTIAESPRHTALLVDMDLRRPAVARTLGLTPTLGVEDVLSGECDVARALYRLRSQEQLVILPARAPVAASSELLGAVRGELLVRELRERYPDRVVMLDLPPVLEVEDAVVIAPYLDCVLFVACEGQTMREDVTAAIGLLSRTTVIGTVLNQAYDLIQTEAYG